MGLGRMGRKELVVISEDRSCVTSGFWVSGSIRRGNCLMYQRLLSLHGRCSVNLDAKCVISCRSQFVFECDCTRMHVPLPEVPTSGSCGDV
jgi:hypothetical protein